MKVACARVEGIAVTAVIAVRVGVIGAKAEAGAGRGGRVVADLMDRVAAMPWVPGARPANGAGSEEWSVRRAVRRAMTTAPAVEELRGEAEGATPGSVPIANRRSGEDRKAGGTLGIGVRGPPKGEAAGT